MGLGQSCLLIHAIQRSILPTYISFITPHLKKAWRIDSASSPHTGHIPFVFTPLYLKFNIVGKD